MRKELQKLRKSKNLTQKCVAEHLGIIKEAYQKIEYGTRGTSEDNWLKLFKFFGETIPLNRLMENAPTKESGCHDTGISKATKETQRKPYTTTL
jgi:DNA-binding XRE family transcriptional regulator